MKMERRIGGRRDVGKQEELGESGERQRGVKVKPL